MRQPALWLSLTIFLAACSGGDHATTAGAPDQERDLTVPASSGPEAPVVSRIELEPPAAAVSHPQTPRTVKSVAAVPADKPVVFTDDLDLPRRPTALGPKIPILGAGAGSVLSAGNTVTAFGPPVTFGDSVSPGTSPWPEVDQGDYPAFDRATAGSGLVIRAGGGGHGTCPRGRGGAFDLGFFPTR